MRCAPGFPFVHDEDAYSYLSSASSSLPPVRWVRPAVSRDELVSAASTGGEEGLIELLYRRQMREHARERRGAEAATSRAAAAAAPSPSPRVAAATAAAAASGAAIPSPSDQLASQSAAAMPNNLAFSPHVSATPAGAAAVHGRGPGEDEEEEAEQEAALLRGLGAGPGRLAEENEAYRILRFLLISSSHFEVARVPAGAKARPACMLPLCTSLGGATLLALALLPSPSALLQTSCRTSTACRLLASQPRLRSLRSLAASPRASQPWRGTAAHFSPSTGRRCTTGAHEGAGRRRCGASARSHHMKPGCCSREQPGSTPSRLVRIVLFWTAGSSPSENRHARNAKPQVRDPAQQPPGYERHRSRHNGRLVRAGDLLHQVPHNRPRIRVKCVAGAWAV